LELPIFIQEEVSAAVKSNANGSSKKVKVAETVEEDSDEDSEGLREVLLLGGNFLTVAGHYLNFLGHLPVRQVGPKVHMPFFFGGGIN